MSILTTYKNKNSKYKLLKALYKRLLLHGIKSRSGVPSEVRTHDLRIRNSALYPAEL